MTLDEAILIAINSWSTPILDAWFEFVTRLGGFETGMIVTAFVAIALVRSGKLAQAAVLSIGVGGAAVINQVLKYTIERPRPDLWEQLVIESSYSFPSGHAMVSMALAASLIAILWHTKWRRLSVVVGAVYVLMIGFSRLYLGVHYPTDVLAGWLFSFVWVLAVVYVVKRLALPRAN